MQTHVLGIDVGTGGTRAVIVGEDGRIVASATEEHAPFASPQIGWAEQDPEDWWRACTISVRKALTNAGLRADQIACVGFSGQMHGAVMLTRPTRWFARRSYGVTCAATNNAGTLRNELAQRNSSASLAIPRCPISL